MKISLGPAPSCWGGEELKKFYQEIARSHVDAVFIGEIVCPKRRVLSPADLKEITKILRESGKKVFFSSLALVTSEKEFASIRQLFSIGDGIEANTISILNLYQASDPIAANQDLIIGPFLNIYNWKAANYLAKFNPERIIVPFELPGRSIEDIAQKSSIPIEVTVWGNLSTSLSWRCYTARTFDLTQANCQKKCLEYPDGIVLKTVDNQDLFLIDGSQVLAAKTHCLIKQLDKLDFIGVSSIRIQPHREHTVEIVNIFQEVIAGKKNSKEALEELSEYAPHGLCNGWFWGEAGWKYIA